MAVALKLRFKTLAVWAVGPMLALYLLFSILAGKYLAEASLRLPRNHLAAAYVRLAQDRVKSLGVVLQDVSVAANDGVTLRGWFAQAGPESSATVLLLHGVTNNRLGMGGYAELLLRNGFNVLMPDARAHGESGGEIASYGLREAPDVHAWVDWLETTHPAPCVYGLGESMGAAILLQSLKYEHRFCAVVAESSFSDFREGAFDRIGERFHQGSLLGRTLLRPMIESAIAYSRLKFGLDFSGASPLRAVRESMTPVLLVHGSRDLTIRPRNALNIAAAAPDHVSLWLVPGAAHCGAWSTAPQEFESRLLGWFRSHGPGGMVTTVRSAGLRTP